MFSLPRGPRLARLRRVLTAAFMAALMGCAGPSQSRDGRGPEGTIRRYVQAIRTGDARQAYRLLDEQTRAQVPFERFRRLMHENREELQDQAEQLAEHAERGIQPTARVRIGPRQRLVLSQSDPGRWKIRSGVLEAPVLRTPRDAVLALRQALKRRSLRGVERVLARETRAELEAEIDRFLEETADELDLEYDIRGNRATVRTTSGRQIQLVREAGEWHVLDVK